MTQVVQLLFITIILLRNYFGIIPVVSAFNSFLYTTKMTSTNYYYYYSPITITNQFEVLLGRIELQQQQQQQERYGTRRRRRISCYGTKRNNDSGSNETNTTTTSTIEKLSSRTPNIPYDDSPQQQQQQQQYSKNDSTIKSIVRRRYNNPSEDNNNSYNNNDLLRYDILSLLIGYQLLGLLNSINDPMFVINGGWFQPIDATSSFRTVPQILQMFVTTTLLYTIITTTIIPQQVSSSSSSISSPSSSLLISFRSTVVCTTLTIFIKFIAAIGISFVLQLFDSPDDRNSIDNILQGIVQSTLQEYYISTLAIGTVRYIIVLLYYNR